MIDRASYDNNDFIMGLSSEQWTALNEDENKPMYNRFRQVWCPGSTFMHFSQCGDCCALRATMILISFYSVLAGLRPAGSHCENSGSSDGTGASARSGCANQRSLLCPLSERGYRHPLLFAVLDLLVLLDQAKSTEERKCTTEEIDSSEKIPTPRSAASYLRVGACGGSPLGACSAVLRR